MSYLVGKSLRRQSYGINHVYPKTFINTLRTNSSSLVFISLSLLRNLPAQGGGCGGNMRNTALGVAGTYMNYKNLFSSEDQNFHPSRLEILCIEFMRGVILNYVLGVGFGT